MAFSQSMRLILALCIAGAMSACLPDAIPAEERQNILVNGKEVPIGLVSAPDDSSRVYRKLFQIIFEDALGYNVLARDAPNYQEAYYAVAGCTDPGVPGDFTAKGCGQPSQNDHIALEIRSEMLPDIALFAKTYKDVDGLVPSHLSTTQYFRFEHIYLLPASYEKALNDEGLSLQYFKSWDTKWNDASIYFSKLTDFDIANEILLCSSSSKHSDPLEVDTYIRETQDNDGIENGKFKCWNDAFVTPPGCRNDVSKCVPLITGGDGWQFQSLVQKATVFNTALAVGIAKDDDSYKELPKKYNVAFYWWGPDITFFGLGAKYIVYQEYSLPEWTAGRKTTAFASPKYTNYMLSSIATELATATIAKTASNINFDDIWMDVLLGSVTEELQREPDREVAIENAVCSWMKENLALAQSWIPRQTECVAGTGLVDADGNFVADLASASRCQFCPPGRFSEPLDDTHTCSKCRAGTRAGSGGQLVCDECEPGSFAPRDMATVCDLCPTGTYQPEKRQTTCIACPKMMTTKDMGFESLADCFCPESFFRPCYDPGNQSQLRQQCACDPKVYRGVQSNRCLECPEGMVCEFGADEANLPCKESDVPAGPYPRVNISYNTLFEAPYSVYKCYDGIVCPGGPPESCTPNAWGIACGRCDDGYYRTREGLCVDCGSVLRAPILPILVLVLVVPTGILLVYRFGASDIQDFGGWKNSCFGITYVSLVFVQTAGVMTSLMPVVPSSIETLLGWTPLLSDLLSQFRLECSLTQDFLTTFVGKLCMPLLAALAFATIYGVLYPTKFRLNLDVFIGTYGSAFNVTFIAIMNLTFSLYQTHPHPNGEASLNTQPHILRSSSDWSDAAIVAGFAVTFYCVGASVLYIYAMVVAPMRWHIKSFRQKWKFLVIQMRPSAYWWMLVSIIKGIYLGMCTVVFDSPVFQTGWLGFGLLLYFVGVFSLLPWRSKAVLCLDVTLHYLLAVMCLLMPFLVEPSDDDVGQVATTFLGVFFAGLFATIFSICTLIYLQSPQAQRRYRFIYDMESRKLVALFQMLTDAEAIEKVLKSLAQVEFDMITEAVKILDVEMLGTFDRTRLQWREQGMATMKEEGKFGLESAVLL